MLFQYKWYNQLISNQTDSLRTDNEIFFHWYHEAYWWTTSGNFSAS
jgi:hypothetical protein